MVKYSSVPNVMSAHIMPACSCQILPSPSRMQLYAEDARCSASSGTAGDVTSAQAGLPQARTTPTLSNCSEKRNGHMFSPLKIWSVNSVCVYVSCLLCSDKVFSIGILKGSQGYVSCFFALVETVHVQTREAVWLGHQVTGSQPPADPHSPGAWCRAQEPGSVPACAAV